MGSEEPIKGFGGRRPEKLKKRGSQESPRRANTKAKRIGEGIQKTHRP